MESVRYPKLGIVQAVDEIEKAIHVYMYVPWYSLQEKQRRRARNRFIRILRKELLKDFWIAIALDILEGGTIHTNLHMFHYLRLYMFKNSTRKMLVFLKDVLENDEKERNRHVHGGMS
jgi:hypothetical protein